ncbi:unnamed protein product, partial [Mesorhabditis spiculigera]
MSWRDDPRIKKLLEKATLENLLKPCFERVHEKDEIQKMESTLKYALDKYEENEESETEPLTDECLDALCEITMNHGKNHTPESLLTLSKLFIKVEDWRLACEVIWCSASLAIQEFITDRQLNVKLDTQGQKRAFTRALSHALGNQFSVFEMCHLSFYTNRYGGHDANAALVEAKDFIQKLRAINGMPHLLIATTEGTLYCYRIEHDGGECHLVRQHRIGK